MITVSTFVVTFVAVELLALFTIYNLELGFLPAVVIATIVSGWATRDYDRSNACRDLPEPVTYRVSVQRAMAAIKRVLRTYYQGRDRWHINYDDKQPAEIQASFYLEDKSFDDMRWLVPEGVIKKSINLHLTLTPLPELCTVVTMKWVVDYELCRQDCNDVIDGTTERIDRALVAAEEWPPRSRFAA